MSAALDFLILIINQCVCLGQIEMSGFWLDTNVV
jgi:hypothetical protein